MEYIKVIVGCSQPYAPISHVLDALRAPDVNLLIRPLHHGLYVEGEEVFLDRLDLINVIPCHLLGLPRYHLLLQRA